MGFFDRFRSQPKPQGDPFWDWLDRQPDCLGAMLSMRLDPDQRYRMQVGYAAGSWRQTEPRTHMLVVGPSQGSAGKTSGMLIPTVLFHDGPALVTATKWDVVQALAMARARLGDVWWYDPSGEPAPPGFRELRFSPIVGAEDWTLALETARQLMDAADPENVVARQVDNHFKVLGSKLIACCLHFAAVTGRNMSWVVDRIDTADLSEGGELEHVQRQMMDVPVAEKCVRTFIGIINHESRPRSGGDIFTTAQVALRAYQGKALRVARDVNFDPLAFVVGEPDAPSNLYVEPRNEKQQMLANMGVLPRLLGRYDTIIASLPLEKQRIYGPALIALVQAIRRATYAVARHDQSRGLSGRMPVLLALDEMYGAPIPDLPELLAEGASQNLLILGALQDMPQADARWGAAGKSFLTLWPNIVLFKGLRTDEVEQFSRLAGEHDVPKSSYSENEHGRWRESVSSERRRRLPVEIITGGDPNKPGQELIFTAGGHWQYFETMPYYKWPCSGILIQSAEWTMKGPKEHRVLPFPDLARGGDLRTLYAGGGQALVDWYLEVRAQWEQQFGGNDQQGELVAG